MTFPSKSESGWHSAISSSSFKGKVVPREEAAQRSAPLGRINQIPIQTMQLEELTGGQYDEPEDTKCIMMLEKNYS